MKAIPPEGPSNPYQPQMSPPETPASPEAAPPPLNPMPTAPPPLLAPPPSDSPSPIGLVVAGAGLILLCVSVLLPRISIDYEGGDDYGYFGLSSLSGGTTFAIDTSTVILTVALLVAVGLSAHRSPGLRWPTRLSAVGLAGLTAAFAYHPVTVMRQFFQDYEDSSGDDEFSGDSAPEITIEADSGMYLAIIAVALLAASTFLMRMRPRQQVYYQPMPPAPAGGPGASPTVTVTPG
ncbi:hypothetical protein [Glycomyces tenuis]|uniref:hypothetical protein n=2 Tax=Glycomyces tenuis TaxID=58116 RepID=UPI00138E361B|nr:hypothetical protein [Glycomyces tenuis]